MSRQVSNGGYAVKKIIIILAIFSVFLCSCGGQNKGVRNEKTTLVIGVFDDNAERNRQIALFNESNEEYCIEIKKYERAIQDDEDGVYQLQREVMTGKGPDIIDFGREYSITDIMGKYTEDLLPYLQSTVENQGNDYFWNVLNAFSYHEGLYALPISFTLQTFAGKTELLGSQKQWNISEMISCYKKQPKNIMLYPGEMKTDVFGTLLMGSMDYYIDWAKGTCVFDGKEFQQLMTFANSFPGELQMEEDVSLKQIFHEGKSLLLPLYAETIYDLCKAEYIFGDSDITYIGFPVEAECGTVIKPSDSMLAINVNSKYKEASWDFIYGFLNKEYQSSIEVGFPICKNALEEKLEENKQVEYLNSEPIVKNQILFEGEVPIDIYCITEKQADTLMELIGSASLCTSIDYSLYNIILEEAIAYFQGDKTLEDAVDIIQSRASVYVGERVK